MTPAVSFLPLGASTVAMRKEAMELRRTLKPLMEKRRRARINDSLNQLKTLILPLMGKDNCRPSKLEKADILEMTVKFLTSVPKTPPNDSTVSYMEGYEACLQRLSALLPRTRLDRENCARVHDFIQQSLRTSPPPPCRTCSARTPSTLHKRTDITRREKRTRGPGDGARDAPPEAPAAQPVWRPW